MKKCYSCDVEITQSNKSKEHIIPNSCGGRWVSEGLLCQECNSTLGDSLDAVLAKQINDLANLLMIERDRGTPNPTKGELESSGEIYFIQSSGKPVMSKPQIQEESHNSLLRYLAYDVAVVNPLSLLSRLEYFSFLLMRAVTVEAFPREQKPLPLAIAELLELTLLF